MSACYTARLHVHKPVHSVFLHVVQANIYVYTLKRSAEGNEEVAVQKSEYRKPRGSAPVVPA